MGQALDNTLDFVKQREQFGRPIGKATERPLSNQIGPCACSI